ncbi:MAG: hypothetical protein ACFE96_11175 [Candidatus Hermodarchaeota archaeon]
MVLSQLTPTRILTVYVAQGIILFVFLYLALRILLRDRKRLNVFFAGLYISPPIGILMNFIYAPLTDETIVLVLNFIANATAIYAPIFIVVFDLILLKSEKIISTTKQLVILIGYGIAVLCAAIFHFTPSYGVTINASTNWSPVWSLPIFIYVYAILTCFATIPAAYFSIKIYKKFEDEVLKKKWRFFIFGFIALMTFMYLIFLSNTLDNPTFRTLLGIVGLILALLGGLSMYYGVGRQIQK